MSTETTAPSSRLREFLLDRTGDRGLEVIEVAAIPGGMSRLVQKAVVRWSDGAEQKLLLRSDPETEGVFRSERDPEWRLLRALNQMEAPRTPKALWYDEDGTFFGTKTIVTDFCDGANLHHLIQQYEDLDQRTSLFCRTIASIHQVPLSALPPEMAPGCSWDDYIDSHIDDYARAERNLGVSNPVFRYLSARLRHLDRPPEMPFTLVHGDAQPGNVIVEEGQLPLVIDWEFTRIGDPREDLAYYAQIPMPPNIYQMDPAGYLAQYRELTGFSEELVNTDTVDWFRTMAMSALIIQVAQGTDSFAQGGPGGVLVTYLTNAITFNSNEGYRSIARWAGRKGVRP